MALLFICFYDKSLGGKGSKCIDLPLKSDMDSGSANLRISARNRWIEYYLLEKWRENGLV